MQPQPNHTLLAHGKGPMMMQNNLTMPSKLNSTIGGAILTRKKPIEDKDDPPPPIS